MAGEPLSHMNGQEIDPRLPEQTGESTVTEASAAFIEESGEDVETQMAELTSNEPKEARGILARFNTILENINRKLDVKLMTMSGMSPQEAEEYVNSFDFQRRSALADGLVFGSAALASALSGAALPAVLLGAGAVAMIREWRRFKILADEQGRAEEHREYIRKASFNKLMTRWPMPMGDLRAALRYDGPEFGELNGKLRNPDDDRRFSLKPPWFGYWVLNSEGNLVRP